MKENGESVLVISHRRSLVRMFEQRLGITSYLDTEKRAQASTPKELATIYKHFVTSLDSLPKLYPDEHKYDVVIIDEAEQVFGHLMADTLSETRPDVIVHLQHRLNVAKEIYLLDADLGPMSFNVLQKIVPDRVKQPIRAFQNSWKPAGKELFLSEKHSCDELLGDLLSNLKNGKRCFVATNSRTLAKEIQSAAQQDTTRPLRILLATRDTVETDEVKRFVAAPDKVAYEYDLIIASPTLGTGLDISFDGGAQIIDTVYGFFRAGITTHFDMDQQLARVRNPGEIKVWISPRTFNYETDASVIQTGLENTTGFKIYLDRIGQNGEKHYRNMFYHGVFAEIESMHRGSKNNPRAHFIALREHNGWAVLPLVVDAGIAAHGRIHARNAKKFTREEEAQAIVNARSIEGDEVERIRAAHSAGKSSVSDQYALQRYYLQNWYGTEVTAALVLQDNNWQQRYEAERFELLHLSASWINGYEPGAGCNKFYSDDSQWLNKWIYLTRLFGAAGLWRNGRFDLGTEVTHSSLEAFAETVRADSAILNQLFNLDVRADLNRKPMMMLRDTLKLVGLTTLSRRDQRGGCSRTYYRIDPASHDRMEAFRQRGNLEKRLDRVKGIIEQYKASNDDSSLLTGTWESLGGC